MNTDKNRIHEEELQDDSSNSTVEGKLLFEEAPWVKNV